MNQVPLVVKLRLWSVVDENDVVRKPDPLEILAAESSD